MKWAAVFGWPLVGAFILTFEATLRFALGEPLRLRSALWTLFAWSEWALLAPFVVWLSLRYPYRQGERALFFLVHCTAPIPVSLAHTGILMLARTLVLGHPGPPAVSPTDVYIAWMPIHATHDVLVYAGTLVATRMTVYLRASWKREQERLELEHRIARAELDTYKLQLPIAVVDSRLQEIARAIDRDPVEAERRIAEFSAFLRQSLAAVEVREEQIATDEDTPPPPPISFLSVLALAALVLPVAGLFINVLLVLSNLARDLPVTWVRFFYNMAVTVADIPVIVTMAWLGSRVKRISVLAVIALALPTAWAFVLFTVTTGWETARLYILESTRAIDFLFCFGTALAAFAYTRYRSWRTNAVAVTELDARLLRTRARLLRTQLNPHLLFNALNSIAALLEDDPASAREMADRLRRFVVRVLETAERHEVTLDDELELLRTYIAIENVRFENRIAFDIRSADDARASRIPALLLQPLVENAVRHGLSPDLGGRIRISAKVHARTLHIEVADDGQPDESAEPGEGIGLTNTRARLRQRYGEAFTMRAERRRTGFHVLLAIPRE